MLIITEKPRVAQQMALALSSSPKKTVVQGVSYFEFDREGRHIYVAPAVGHVYSLAEKTKSPGYPSFDIHWVPAFKRKESAYTRKYVNVLSQLSKQVDEVYSACDYDVEGSLIAGNVIRFLAPNKKAKRMLFSSLMPSELQEAFEQAGPLDTPSIQAGEARHTLDWYWGINVSRALMSSLKKAGAFKVLSIGRVQGPTLALLSRREKEIQGFQSQVYWQVFAKAKEIVFVHEKQRFFDHAISKKILAECHLQTEGVIAKLEVKRFPQPSPVPFDLTTLQVEAYRCFSMPPSRTLEVAQNLYEAALISYPRTASQKLPTKLGLPKILNLLKQHRSYSALAQQLIDGKRFVPREGSKSDSAHVAIYPTGLQVHKLGVEEQKLFDLVVKRFLACFAPPAERESAKVHLTVATQLFLASGIRTLSPGWTAFYAPYAPLEENILPSFKEGERLAVQSVWEEQKETKPPKRFTPASVVKELEKHKIGTKSTRSAVIDTLFNRNYLTNRKSIQVTAFGLSVFEALQTHVPEILSEQLTRKFEKQMETIQEGRVAQQHVIDEGREALTLILNEFRSKEAAIGAELSKGLVAFRRDERVLGACTKCAEGKLVIKKSKFGFFAACNKYPECKTTFSLPKNSSVLATNKACLFCKTPVIKVVRKGKRPFEMCLLPNCESKASWGQKSMAPVKKPLKPVGKKKNS